MASWRLATTRRVAALKLADFVIQVGDLVPQFADGAVCIVLNVVDHVALAINLVIGVFKFGAKLLDFRSSLAKLELERAGDGRADSLGVLLCRRLERGAVEREVGSVVDRPFRANIAASSCMCDKSGLGIVTPGARHVVAHIGRGWASGWRHEDSREVGAAFCKKYRDAAWRGEGLFAVFAMSCDAVVPARVL
jgi:hypothetical protein